MAGTMDAISAILIWEGTKNDIYGQAIGYTDAY